MRTRHLSHDRKAARAQARAARAAFVEALAPAVRAGLQAALAERVMPQLPRPAVLASYCAVGHEIDPAVLERPAAAAGWRLAFPRVTKGEALGFHVAPREDFVQGALGIAEPPADAPLLRPDVLLVPLLEADRAGNRLGQGGGYYDRTLAHLRKTGPVMAIGICWDVQLVDAIHAEPWDEPLDAVATPTAFHALPARAKTRG